MLREKAAEIAANSFLAAGVLMEPAQTTDQQYYQCYLESRGVLNCGHFRVERTTPNTTQVVSIYPNVDNWRSWDEWRYAVTRGRDDGLDFLQISGCQIISIQDRRWSSERRVVVRDIYECMPYLLD